MKIQITGLGEAVPQNFIREANFAQGKISNLEVRVEKAPSFSEAYPVDSPQVAYSNNGVKTVEYGRNGLDLIKDVASGEK